MRSRKVILLLFLIFIMASCSNTPPPQPITLTINYPSADMFYVRMGYAFEDKYPDIKLKVIERALDEPIDSSADIIFTSSIDQYKQLAENNKLVPLSTSGNREKDITSGLSPIVVELLTLDDGEWYGLAPFFSSNGLFYNIDLFHKYNVPLPRNGMSWEEVYDLAAKFPSEQEDGTVLYGFTSNYYKSIPINLILSMGETNGLHLIDPDTYTLKFNTKEWLDVTRTVLHAIQQKAVFNGSEDELGAYGEGPLIAGTTAMQFGSYTTAINMERYFESMDDDKVMEWGVVTVPVDPLNATYSDSYRLDEIYGINRSTLHKDAAWKFISFIMTDRDYYEHYLMENWEYGIPTNEVYRNQITDKDLSALYTLLPWQDVNRANELLSIETVNAFKALAQQHIDEYLIRDVSIEECVALIEASGQLMLDHMKVE